MDFAQILIQVNQIIKDILDNQEIILTAEMTFEDVEDWESLDTPKVIAALEKHFKIQRFSLLELAGFVNIGSICQGIKDKL